MRPRILFVVMSAVHNAAAVDELARALAPHAVLVHHDFSQTPEFELRAPNVLFVPEPLRTAWGRFSFVDAIFHSLRYAMENLDFDYLQLLSPTCLPIKPIRAFEAHISGSAEAHFGCIDLLANHDALMSLGYRAFTPSKSWRYRLARHLTFSQYYRDTKGHCQEAGIWYKTGFAAGQDGRMTLAARLARLTIIALSNPAIGRHRFDGQLRPYVGSVWFGARRHVIGALMTAYARPGIRDFFSKIDIAEEFLIPTLLKTLEIRTGPLNHYINVFNEAHPRWMADADFETLRRSPAFFARKFPDYPESSVRKRVLDDLVYGRDEAIERIHAVRAVANG
jgi:hypothetical protein